MMAGTSTIIEARVDGDRKAKAAAVLDELGLTIGQAITLLINRIAEDGDLPAGLALDRADHDAWIAAEVQRALSDERESLSDAQTREHFASRRGGAARRSST